MLLAVSDQSLRIDSNNGFFVYWNSCCPHRRPAAHVTGATSSLTEIRYDINVFVLDGFQLTTAWPFLHGMLPSTFPYAVSPTQRVSEGRKCIPKFSAAKSLVKAPSKSILSDSSLKNENLRRLSDLFWLRRLPNQFFWTFLSKTNIDVTYQTHTRKNASWRTEDYRVVCQ